MGLHICQLLFRKFILFKRNLSFLTIETVCIICKVKHIAKHHGYVRLSLNIKALKKDLMPVDSFVVYQYAMLDFVFVKTIVMYTVS